MSQTKDQQPNGGSSPFNASAFGPFTLTPTFPSSSNNEMRAHGQQPQGSGNAIAMGGMRAAWPIPGEQT